MNPEQLAKSGSEHGHQVALFAWANMAAQFGFDVAWNMNAYINKECAVGVASGNARPVPALDNMFAIPNGGERHGAVAAKMKAEGVKSGVPDIMLPEPVGKWLGLFVEMKKHGGKLTGNQPHWIRTLTVKGYRVYVCEGWRHAAESIQYYIEGKDVYEQ